RDPRPAHDGGGIGSVNTSQYTVKNEPRRQASTKPPYRLMTMAEIAAVPKNGFKLVSTFSGCGGSCLGFEMLGFEVLWANEFIPAAREVYALNHPAVILDDRDIRAVKPEEILTVIGK